MTYIVRMDGEKVHSFDDLEYAKKWAKRYCRGVVTITGTQACNKLPKASKPIKPNLDMPDLRYKPFVSLT